MCEAVSRPQHRLEYPLVSRPSAMLSRHLACCVFLVFVYVMCQSKCRVVLLLSGHLVYRKVCSPFSLEACQLLCRLVPCLWRSLSASFSFSVSAGVVTGVSAFTFLNVLASNLDSCSTRKCAKGLISFSAFQWYNLSRSVLALASCRVSAIVSTSCFFSYVA